MALQYGMERMSFVAGLERRRTYITVDNTKKIILITNTVKSDIMMSKDPVAEIHNMLILNECTGSTSVVLPTPIKGKVLIKVGLNQLKLKSIGQALEMIKRSEFLVIPPFEESHLFLSTLENQGKVESKFCIIK